MFILYDAQYVEYVEHILLSVVFLRQLTNLFYHSLLSMSSFIVSGRLKVMNLVSFR